MIEKIKDKLINNNVQFELLIFLFFLYIPFFGDAGFSILNYKWDYYTMILFLTIVFCFIAFIKDKNLREDKCPFYIDKTYFWYFLANGIFIVLMVIISNLGFEKFIGIGTYLLFPFVLSARGVNKETFKSMGFMAFIVWLYQMIDTINAPHYFNINTYSFIIIISALLSLFMFNDTKSNLIKLGYATIVLGTSIALVKLKYECDTQFIAGIAAYILYIFRCLLYNKKISLSVYTILFLGVVFLPIITLILMKYGVITGEVFTYRGLQWLKSYNSIHAAGQFIVTNYDPMAHNGFFDIAIKMTMQGAVIYMLSLYVLGYHIIKYLPKKDECASLLLVMFLYYLIINMTESFFMSVTDWGFTALILGLLLARIKPYVKNKFLEVKCGCRTRL